VWLTVAEILGMASVLLVGTGRKLTDVQIATPYEDLLRWGSSVATPKSDRTGTGTAQPVRHQMRYDLTRRFPADHHKKVHTKSVIYELLWFLRGDSKCAMAAGTRVSIWDEWGFGDRRSGPVYGVQWRRGDAVG